jgi:Glycoside Hydrolase Family 113
MKRLAIIPVVVLSLVIAVPLSMGSDPLRFGQLVTKLWNSRQTHVDTQTPERPNKVRRGSASSLDIVSTVAHPWKTGLPQWGVQVYWAYNPSDSQSYTQRKAQRIVNYIVRLNANSICISFPLFMSSSNAILSTGPATPSPSRIGILIKAARRAYLRVTVRPIVGQASPGSPIGRYRVIRPSNWNTWFASYQALLIPYARVSQEYGAASFVVGTELSSMEGDRRWKGIVAAIKKKFAGEIAYDAAWTDYISRYVNMPVYHLGVDAFFPVNAPDSAPISKLVAVWNDWLDRKSTGPLPRVMLSEIGITPQDGAYPTPDRFHPGNAYSPQVQANWYKAACIVTRERDMAGLYVWSLAFNSDLGKPTPPSSASPFAFAGRPQSERALRACFSSSYQVRSLRQMRLEPA